MSYAQSTNLPIPDLKVIPDKYQSGIQELFSRWQAVRQRNHTLSEYYNLHQAVKELNVAIPEQFRTFNCCVGWCHKAVKVRAVRSIFDGFVFSGTKDDTLDALVSKNKLKTLYKQAYTMSLVHGVSAITVMAGVSTDDPVRVRVYSANQFCCIWDKDENRVGAGIVLADTDIKGKASRYVAHFPDAVLVIERHTLENKDNWSVSVEPNPLGIPMMDVFVHDADVDRPLGHSLLSPELLGIVDKAMRDVERMEVGAEFFTFPQRYVLGASQDLFGVKTGQKDEDGDDIYTASPAKKIQAYIGAYLSITKDDDGDVPQVGQFSPAQAENFTRVFENDAQRFSGCACVPLSQLGVLGNNYTSSDALGAANDPLILDVQDSNLANACVLENVARMMMAIQNNTELDKLTPEQKAVQAYFKDPSMPTISARADAWCKIGSQDKSIVGTRVYYENIGFAQATIDRIFSEKRQLRAIDALNRIASSVDSSPLMPNGDVKDGK